MGILREDFRPFYGKQECVRSDCHEAAEWMRVVRYSEKDKIEKGTDREVKHFCQEHKREESE